MRAITIVSGGKDSIYAFYLMLQQGFEINRWVTFVPQIKESYMLHSINTEFVSFQAELSNANHSKVFVSGEKEEEIIEMLHYLKSLKKKESFNAIICGAVRSEYQKHRLDMISEELGIPCYAPLWHKNSEKLLHEIVGHGFEFIVVHAGKDFEKWVGRKVCRENVDEFIDFLKSVGADISGEGGEYETFVVKTPFWKKEISVEGKVRKEENTISFVITRVS